MTKRRSESQIVAILKEADASMLASALCHLIDAILALIHKHPWGFPKCRKHLRVLGYRWNHKRIYRVYLELKLNMRRKSKRRLPNKDPLPLVVPEAMNQY